MEKIRCHQWSIQIAVCNLDEIEINKETKALFNVLNDNARLHYVPLFTMIGLCNEEADAIARVR